MEMTDETFWEAFWESVQIPCTVDRSFKNDRVIAEIIERYVPKANGYGAKAFEVGCAPGKWLVFFNRERGYAVEGCEFVPSAAMRTIENLIACGIPADRYAVHTADFFRTSFARSFDVVYSLGFVEHFTDFEGVLDRHLNMTSIHGYLVIGYPSFRGIGRLVQTVIDRYLDRPLLVSHNLAIMRPARLRQFARKRPTTLFFAGYIGGFEAGLFQVAAVRNSVLRSLLKIVVHSLELLFPSGGNSMWGSYVMAVMRREA